MWNRGWLNFRGQKKGQRICMWWLHAGFPDSHPFPEPDSVLIAGANKVVNFKIWTCHAVHFYIGLTMSVERKTGERMIRHFVYLRGGHFIYLRGDQNLQIFQRVPRTRLGESICCCLSALSCLYRALSRVAWNAGCKFLRPFLPLLWIMLLLFKGPLLPLKGSLSHAAWIFATVWDVWILLTAGLRVLPLVPPLPFAKLASCQVVSFLWCFHPHSE